MFVSYTTFFHTLTYFKKETISGKLQRFIEKHILSRTYEFTRKCLPIFFKVNIKEIAKQVFYAKLSDGSHDDILYFKIVSKINLSTFCLPN